MYESPIETYYFNDIHYKITQDAEETIYECVAQIGLSINKKELIKALNYDRNQYNKGYNDALDEVREKIAFMSGDAKTVSDVLNILEEYKAAPTIIEADKESEKK